MQNASVSAVLVKMQVATKSIHSNILGKMSDDFERVLGYTPLRERCQSYEQLIRLSDMGIVPYTEKSVLEYKSKMVRDNTSLSNHLANNYLYIFATSGLILLGSLVYMAAARWWSLLWPFNLAYTTVISFAICVAIMQFERKIVENQGTYEWIATPIKDYKQEIPIDFLNLAYKIKEAFPEAQLSIEHLNFNRVNDPFLTLKLGSETYYIAVWDEPTFNDQKMQIGP